MDNFAEGYAIGRDSGNSNDGGARGNDGAAFLWILVILAMFGWGRGGFGGGSMGGTGDFVSGYDFGKLATTNDVASGFANNAIIGSLNDLQLGQAGINQTLCQGFNGVNTAILTSSHATDKAVCDLGYRLQDCCCQTQRAIEGVNYNMATNTNAIVQAGNANTQRILDYLTTEKIDSLNRELTLAQGQLSQANQTNNIVNALRPPIVPAVPAGAFYGYCNQQNACC